MKKFVTLSVSAWVLAILSGIGFASGPGAVPAGFGSVLPDGAIQFGAPACPDIASTDIFRSKGLEYATSKEFAEAVVAVASGSSRYSPEEIPAEWRTTAAEWRAYVKAYPASSASAAGSPYASLPGADQTMFLESRESCAPSLLYLASLEYRARMGNEEIRPVFPHVVRAGTHDLSVRIAEKRRMDGIFAKRAEEIASRIAEAERLGAGECAPGGIARAKMDLERARRESVGIRTGVGETEALFVNVAGYADSLLKHQQFASRKGIRCFAD